MEKKPKRREMVTVSLYVTKELLKHLTRRADDERRSLSQVATFILEQEFAPKEAKA